MKYTLLLLFTVLLGASASSQTASTGNGNVYAVVIGVSNYQDPDVPRLQFANRDAGIFAEFLQSRAGGSVPKANIRLLIDSSATVSAVHMAIRWLTRTCKKNDLVYFYFSGHGDLESMSMFNNAYLICYNTPIESYVGMSLSVTFLNEIANTLSAQTEAKVVLITDACHSGKMAGRENVNALVGQQLLNAKEKEIRIASSQADQLSNENVEWGGGRGVFSYYLLNGLKGLADDSKDGIVTLGEIKNYLQHSMSNDPLLKQEGKVQTPVFKGIDNFTLARVDTVEAMRVKAQAVSDSIEVAAGMAAPMPQSDIGGMMPDDYFISLLKQTGLEAMVDSLKLQDIPAGDIPSALINRLRDSLENQAGVAKLNELLAELKGNADAVNRVNELLVMAFDDKVQEVINNYLKGDEAELERRRYYNIKNNGYDVYPRMLAVALKLTDSSSFYYNILKVKLHYFTGVTLRLKVPVSKDPSSLIDKALAEQLKALALEKKAPYIYNELGILYMLKKQYAKSEANYLEATKRNDTWAIPWANLGGLYALTGEYAKGFSANQRSDSLQPELQNNMVNRGLLNEFTKNILFAEEDYRLAIELNERHFLPFERLGYVYLNMTDYAAADSFFYEADLRKKGYHFDGNAWSVISGTIVMPPMPYISCPLDTSILDPSDFMAFFYWGMEEYKKKNYANAIRVFKKVIDVDPENPLVFHYIGKCYYDQRKWEESEVYFRFAMDYYLPDSLFRQYVDSAIRSKKYPYEHDCFEQFFQRSQYQRKEDLFFMASVYESWNHFEEAGTCYQKLVETEPAEFGGYIKFWQLNERLGRYLQAENLIRSYSSRDADLVYRELNAFYRRMTDRYPDNGEWHYKLGLLLHSRSGQPSMYRYLDTIIWFPKMNDEVFINRDIYYQLGKTDDLKFDRRGTGIPDQVNRMQIMRHSETSYTIPGTHEYCSLADDVYTPRIDGISYLERAASLLTEKPLLAEVNYKIGEIFTWAGSKRQAFPFFKNSLSFDTDNANIRMKIIESGTPIYRNREVLEQLSYLYDSSQINLTNRLQYAAFAMYHNEFDKARKLIEEGDNMYPYVLEEAYDLLGRLNMLEGKYKEALRQYKQYLEQVPDDLYTTYSIARLYARLGKKTEAWKWLDKAIEQGFNYRFVLITDPALEGLRKSAKWNSMIGKLKPKEWNRRIPFTNEPNQGPVN